ncbi:hypothetical protein T261_0346 [Streptomyces lydicus]|nr:hypothetical protein T261_0346 [Streptomyces lydicus]
MHCGRHPLRSFRLAHTSRTSRRSPWSGPIGRRGAPAAQVKQCLMMLVEVTGNAPMELRHRVEWS